MKIIEVGQEMNQGGKEQLEQRCKDLEANRKGIQIRLTGVQPFDDMLHQRDLYGMEKVGKVAFSA